MAQDKGGFEIEKKCLTSDELNTIMKHHREVLPHGYDDFIKRNTNNLFARAFSNVGLHHLGEFTFLYQDGELKAVTLGEVVPVNDGLGCAVYSRAIRGARPSKASGPLFAEFFVDLGGRRFDIEPERDKKGIPKQGQKGISMFAKTLAENGANFGNNGVIALQVLWGIKVGTEGCDAVGGLFFPNGKQILYGRMETEKTEDSKKYLREDTLWGDLRFEGDLIHITNGKLYGVVRKDGTLVESIKEIGSKRGPLERTIGAELRDLPDAIMPSATGKRLRDGSFGKNGRNGQF